VEVRLSDREFAMLEYLLRSNGAVASKFDLMRLGHHNDIGTRSHDQFDTDMYRLRRKMQASDGWPAIHVVRGGYQIVAD
jgi:DNA-binding response OmpR family regulator